jgi:ribosomal subunit interface protein
MAAPVQITFRDIPPSPAITQHVERRAAKLETLFDRLVNCHVVVEEPHRHSRQGKKFHVRVDMFVPGKELVVTRNPEDSKEDLHAAIDDAFGDAERVLEEHARQLQPDTKTHVRPPHGVVARIFHDRGYGFIEADGDGHDVYFHRNSVLDEKFEKISVGTKVRFAEEDGDKGPQASTVHVIGPS